MSGRSIAVDSSALVAIVMGEPEREAFMDCILDSDQVLISTATLLETRIVLYNRKQYPGITNLNEFLSQARMFYVEPDMSMIELAFNAFLFYGKGHGHKAQLNLGDLFSYALAKSRGIPLLFKGEDFALTDIVSAV